MPVWIPLMIGAAAGAGLAAGLGPKEEPMWKKLLIGGALGGTAGLGIGAAMAPAAAGAGAAGGAAAAGGTAAGGTAAGGTAAGGTVAGGAIGGGTAGTTVGGTAAGAGGGIASAAPTAVAPIGQTGIQGGMAALSQPAATTATGAFTPSMTVPMGQMAPVGSTVFPASASTVAPASPGVLGAVTGGLGKVGTMVANNPLVFGATGLGAAGALLPGGEHVGPIKGSKGYKGDASWEGDGSGGGEIDSNGQSASWEPGYYDPNRDRYTGGIGYGRYYFR